MTLELRMPPWDQGAEEACIGSALVDPEAVSVLVPMLRPSDFLREKMQWIWAAIADCARRGEDANVITVAYQLSKSKERHLEEIGGQGFLHELVRQQVSPEGAKHFAGIVLELSQRRRLISAASGFVEALYDLEKTPALLSGQMVERLIRLGADRSRPITRSIGEILRNPVEGDPDGELSREIEAFLENTASADGWSMGWPELDDILGGLEPGRVYSVLAATGLGKSWLGLNVAAALCEQDVPTLLVSTEMPGKEVGKRLVFLTAGHDRVVISRQHHATDRQSGDVHVAESVLAGWPLWVTDVGGIDLDALRMETRRQRHQNGVQALILDHMGDVRVRSARNPVERATEVAQATKEMAMNEYLAVVQIAHVNREAAKGGWVDLHSARDSGSIENYSDVVLTLNPITPAGDNFVGRGDVDAFIARHNWIPIHAAIAKGRSGGKGWSVRALDFNAGGRFVPIEEAEARESRGAAG